MADITTLTTPDLATAPKAVVKDLNTLVLTSNGAFITAGELDAYEALLVSENSNN